MVSTRLGDAPRIENTGSISWKPLRSSSLDDDDDDGISHTLDILPLPAHQLSQCDYTANCLGKEANVCEQLAQGCYMIVE